MLDVFGTAFSAVICDVRSTLIHCAPLMFTVVPHVSVVVQDIELIGFWLRSPHQHLSVFVPPFPPLRYALKVIEAIVPDISWIGLNAHTQR